MTVPLISVIYPNHYQTPPRTRETLTSGSHLSLPDIIDIIKIEDEQPTKVLLALRNMQNVRPMMSLLQMASRFNQDLEVFALRIIPLGDRMGTLMKAQEASETLKADPILEVFKTFAQLNHIPIESMLSIGIFI